MLSNQTSFFSPPHTSERNAPRPWISFLQHRFSRKPPACMKDRNAPENGKQNVLLYRSLVTQNWKHFYLAFISHGIFCSKTLLGNASLEKMGKNGKKWIKVPLQNFKRVTVKSGRGKLSQLFWGQSRPWKQSRHFWYKWQHPDKELQKGLKEVGRQLIIIWTPSKKLSVIRVTTTNNLRWRWPHVGPFPFMIRLTTSARSKWVTAENFSIVIRVTTETDHSKRRWLRMVAITLAMCLCAKICLLVPLDWWKIKGAIQIQRAHVACPETVEIYRGSKGWRTTQQNPATDDCWPSFKLLPNTKRLEKRSKSNPKNLAIWFYFVIYFLLEL